jgi:SAM-dependent methyltransferase
VTVHPSGEHRLAVRPSRPPPAHVRLGPAEAAIFETFVVPRYMSLFGELALEMIADSDDAQVVHLHCRTGYPDRGMAIRLPGAYIVGLDASGAALELARAKAATMPEMVSDYRQVEGLPTPLPEAAFSHAVMLHPPATAEDRGALLSESARLLAPHGQVLLAMPLRGSFQEIFDLLREYALKHDEASVASAVEQSVLVWPTAEALNAELAGADFDFVEVFLRPTSLRFHGGRDFFEDPIARLAVLPDVRSTLNLGEAADKAFAYVREAIDKYWSDRPFELTVNVGCAIGRRTPKGS